MNDAMFITESTARHSSNQSSPQRTPRNTGKSPPHPPAKRVVRNALFSIGMVLFFSGCISSGKRYQLPHNHPDTVSMETTGYCKCGKCCGWKRNWKFQPVFTSGPNKGKPKQVGITAAGTKAGWGRLPPTPATIPSAPSCISPIMDGAASRISAEASRANTSTSFSPPTVKPLNGDGSGKRSRSGDRNVRREA